MGLSNAERQRRFIARLKKQAAAGDAAEITALKAEIARLKAKIRDMRVIKAKGKK